MSQSTEKNILHKKVLVYASIKNLTITLSFKNAEIIKQQFEFFLLWCSDHYIALNRQSVCSFSYSLSRYTEFPSTAQNIPSTPTYPPVPIPRNTPIRLPSNPASPSQYRCLPAPSFLPLRVSFYTLSDNNNFMKCTVISGNAMCFCTVFIFNQHKLVGFVGLFSVVFLFVITT